MLSISGQDMLFTTGGVLIDNQDGIKTKRAAGWGSAALSIIKNPT